MKHRYYVKNLSLSASLLFGATCLVIFSFGGIMESINMIKMGRVLADNPDATTERIEILHIRKKNLMMQVLDIERRRNVTLDSLLGYCRKLHLDVSGIALKHNVVGDDDSKTGHIIVLTGKIDAVLEGLHLMEDSLVSGIKALTLKKNPRDENLVDLQLELILYPRE